MAVKKSDASFTACILCSNCFSILSGILKGVKAVRGRSAQVQAPFHMAPLAGNIDCIFD
jgi:hypothetical protein